MKKFGIFLIFIATAGISSFSQHIKWHNEASDTTRINRLLTKAAAIPDPEKRVAALANEFIGTPYVAGTLESADGEQLTVNIDEVDCTTLVDNIMALALTAGEHRTSWRDFVYNLERIRYRGGSINGYPSRLHYISDWIIDNSHRGNFTEATGDCEARRLRNQDNRFHDRKPQALPRSRRFRHLRQDERCRKWLPQPPLPHHKDIPRSQSSQNIPAHRRHHRHLHG